ncbi:MAG: XRE family transcriptional regulator [Comamonadaceae bacterium]|nr:MAG: XRE family transcriptional regulator [Comamonadaceae bacterium]
MVELETPTARARKIVSHVLQATQRDSSQTAIAAAMGVSESTLSRLLSDHLDKLALVLAHAGLKVAPAESRCFPPDYVDALLLMAKQHINTVQTVRNLEWD